jgi:hypothetical protein
MPYGFGALVVRGARDGASAVFIDGLRVPNVFHFGFGPSVIAPEMIERIDYYPGNFPVRYGQLTGGVVDVTLRPASADHWRGAAEIDMADAGVFAQGPLGEDTTVSLSVRRSYVDACCWPGPSSSTCRTPPTSCRATGTIRRGSITARRRGPMCRSCSSVRTTRFASSTTTTRTGAGPGARPRRSHGGSTTTVSRAPGAIASLRARR